jgi:hypothetical protein
MEIDSEKMIRYIGIYRDLLLTGQDISALVFKNAVKNITNVYLLGVRSYIFVYD